MAFLRKQVKRVLLLLAEEFTTNVSEKNKVKEIIDAILNANDYEENCAKDFLERILREDEEEKQERERVEREKEKEIERVEREKERELQERDKERQFELEKFKLQVAAESASVGSTISAPETSSRKVSLKDLVPKFDPKKIDITLFCMIFERQD